MEIVRAGLARVHDRSLSVLPKDTVLALRVAEREALTNHRFIWATTATTATTASSSSSIGAGMITTFALLLLNPSYYKSMIITL